MPKRKGGELELESFLSIVVVMLLTVLVFANL